MMYLTGVSNPLTRGAQRSDLGLLAQPNNSVHLQADDYPHYAADNGCFSETPTKPFDVERWFAWLEKLPSEQCLFATLPDVVSDPIGTFFRSLHERDRVAELGLPVAWVAQDGLENLPFVFERMLELGDCVFLGGSTDWKLGTGAEAITRRALAEGKHVHMGRVNSLKRMRYAQSIGCHTVDGTYLKFGNAAGREKNFHHLMGWLDALNGDDDQEIAA